MGPSGKVMAPRFAPIGIDWRGSVALMTGFFAKEIVVSTLGILYVTEEAAADELQQALIAVVLAFRGLPLAHSNLAQELKLNVTHMCFPLCSMIIIHDKNPSGASVRSCLYESNGRTITSRRRYFDSHIVNVVHYWDGW